MAMRLKPVSQCTVIPKAASNRRAEESAFDVDLQADSSLRSE
jgi:hypothetical protein